MKLLVMPIIADYILSGNKEIVRACDGIKAVEVGPDGKKTVLFHYKLKTEVISYTADCLRDNGKKEYINRVFFSDVSFVPHLFRLFCENRYISEITITVQ